MLLITHAGKFHADEVTAVSTLELVFDEVTLLRVGKNADLSVYLTESYVNEYGGVLILDTYMRYDMSDFGDTRVGYIDHHHTTLVRDNGFVLATAGLVWKHFGRDCLRRLGVKSKSIDDVWDIIDKGIMAPIDAIDTDQKYKLTMETSGGLVSPPTISSFIGRLNGDSQDPDQDCKFRVATEFMKEVLKGEVNTHIFMETQLEPFQDTLRDISKGCLISDVYHRDWKKLGLEDSSLLYMILPRSDGRWGLWAFPKSTMDRTPRKKIERIPGTEYFIHENKFCASGTKEEMVNLAMFNCRR